MSGFAVVVAEPGAARFPFFFFRRRRSLGARFSLTPGETVGGAGVAASAAGAVGVGGVGAGGAGAAGTAGNVGVRPGNERAFRGPRVLTLTTDGVARLGTGALGEDACTSEGRPRETSGGNLLVNDDSSPDECELATEDGPLITPSAPALRDARTCRATCP